MANVDCLVPALLTLPLNRSFGDRQIRQTLHQTHFGCGGDLLDGEEGSRDKSQRIRQISLLKTPPATSCPELESKVFVSEVLKPVLVFARNAQLK
jgi:hypothetical protein